MDEAFGQELLCPRARSLGGVLHSSLWRGAAIKRYPIRYSSHNLCFYGINLSFCLGYAQSAETAFERYRETGFAIIDWFKFDLSDPTSRAREQIYRVRLMHGLARRNATKLFRKDLGEGIALSQYDMAEVLLGFSAFSLMFLESEMGVHFSEEEKRDMVACWRLIGYHLGIHDEFNLCRSLEHLDDCFADYMVHTKRRILTARDCTHRLQQTAVDGFGLGSGLGSEVWWGFLSAFRSSSKWDGTSLTVCIESTYNFVVALIRPTVLVISK